MMGRKDKSYYYQERTEEVLLYDNNTTKDRTSPNCVMKVNEHRLSDNEIDMKITRITKTTGTTTKRRILDLSDTLMVQRKPVTGTIARNRFASCDSSITSASCSTRSSSSNTNILLLNQQYRRRRKRVPTQGSKLSSLLTQNCRLKDFIPILCTFILCSFMAGTSILIRSGRLFPPYAFRGGNGLRQPHLSSSVKNPIPTKEEFVLPNLSNSEQRHITLKQPSNFSSLLSSEASKINNSSKTGSIPTQVISNSTKISSLEALSPGVTTNNNEFHGWSNPYNIVHVIQTRFMQFQPNLVSLGKARLKLFQSVTIPSIAQQTNRNFLWIIRTDPELDQSILNPLVESLHDVFDHPTVISNIQVVLVASNDNPEGFRQQTCVQDITDETVLFGTLDAVQAYHSAAQNHTMLETRLDADDALATFYVNQLQQSASQNLRTGWMVWCAENHMEWQYTSPWNYTNEMGAIMGLKAIGCITPGLTWGYTTASDRSEIPSNKHTKIRSSVPLCNSNLTKTARRKLRHLQDKYDINVITNGTGLCLTKLGNDVLPAALRARTPTSAGMDHVFLHPYTEKLFPMNKLRTSKWKHIQVQLFDALTTLFGITAHDLYETRSVIQQHLPDIARDAYNGQCTKGHSCKSSAKNILLSLMNSTDSTIANSIITTSVNTNETEEVE